MNEYSKYLSLKVLSVINRGMPRMEVIEVFSMSLATSKRWLKRRGETGDVETGPLPGRPSMKVAALREWLPAQLSANPILTLAERYEAFEKQRGMRVSTATMSRNIRRLPDKWPLKKVLLGLGARRGRKYPLDGGFLCKPPHCL
jgi:transposase